MADTGQSKTDAVRDLKELKDCRFFQRLTGSGFQDSVAAFAKDAADLLGLTVRHMPLYTLHDETHILNVLAWMEWLAGDVIEELSQIECALCVMAAYAHDLGMTLTGPEHAELLSDEDSDERRKYRDFIDGFVDEKYEIERLKNSSDAQDNYAGELLEQHLLTEYLRRTHSDAHATRMRARLNGLLGEESHDSLFVINDQPDQFRRWLDLIAISHNQDVGWLRDQFQREFDSIDTSTHGQTVNAVFISLLLRLADVMDFDSSRTPTILFHHLGLDREFGGRFSSFERLSQQEWKKHLAIHDTPVEPTESGWNLTYLANACDHPAVEKSIREFIEWIRREVAGCRTEIEALKRHATVSSGQYALRLPEVHCRVTPKQVAGQPVYTYRDWHFRLDQQEIIRLLMGESLYGDPSLCIRELLQNSLDALELRDLRLQVPKSERREPVDGIPIKDKPGYFLDENGNEQRLEVHLTWGRGLREDGSDSEDGPWWIQVEDNGVGMTPSVIENFFTQLGRSYYRSAEFESEKADLRRHGLLATPISQFGIGVLSCFMIAERLEVHTCPADASVNNPDPNRRPTDLTITGPGSLFWTKLGTRTKQGTEIRLILRRKLKNEDLSLSHDSDAALLRLRRHFGYLVSDSHSEKRSTFDPAFLAGQYVVWPKYLVRAATSGNSSKSEWKIDGTFHSRLLAPLDTDGLKQKVREWNSPEQLAGHAEWCHFDWSDDEGDLATGSRVRVWFARPRATGSKLDDFSGSLRLSQLSTFVEAVSRRPKLQLLVKSMHVPQVSLDNIQITGGIGASVWVDLRGDVELRLTADRTKAISPENVSRWQNAMDALWQRFTIALVDEVGSDLQRARNLLALLCVNDSMRLDLMSSRISPHETVTSIGKTNAQCQTVVESASCKPACAMFSLSLACQRLLGFELSTGRARRLFRDPKYNLDLDNDLVRGKRAEHDAILNIARNVDRALQVGLIEYDLQRIDHNIDRTTIQNLTAMSTIAAQYECFDTSWAVSTLQQAFWPSLETSWPELELFAFQGRVGNSLLLAPATLQLELESNGRTVAFVDRLGREPDWLVEQQYDVCWPLPSIPIGRLRRDCPQWREDRSFQALGTLSLILPAYFEVWPKHAQALREHFGVPQIYALFPSPELWTKPFCEWTSSDRGRSDHLSILWNIETGAVHYAGGIQTPEETVAKSSTFADLIAEIDNK